MTRQNQAFRPWGACLPQPGSRATPIVDCVWEVVRLTQKPTVKPHAARGTHTSGKGDYNLKWGLGQGGILALNVEGVPSNLPSGSEFPATYYFRLPPEGPTLAPERPKPDGFWRSLDGFWVEHPEVKPPLGHLTEPGSTEVEGRNRSPASGCLRRPSPRRELPAPRNPFHLLLYHKSRGKSIG